MQILHSSTQNNSIQSLCISIWSPPPNHYDIECFAWIYYDKTLTYDGYMIIIVFFLSSSALRNPGASLFSGNLFMAKWKHVLHPNLYRFFPSSSPEPLPREQYNFIGSKGIKMIFFPQLRSPASITLFMFTGAFSQWAGWRRLYVPDYLINNNLLPSV